MLFFKPLNYLSILRSFAKLIFFGLGPNLRKSQNLIVLEKLTLREVVGRESCTGRELFFEILAISRASWGLFSVVASWHTALFQRSSNFVRKLD